MRKGKILSKGSWKRVVRVLACLTVFCTTYALILPAITLEAKSYCGHEEHKHSAECYRQILSCNKEEHVHGDDCYDADGNLICGLEEHSHDESCYRDVLDCGLEEHEHSLICFSNPEADIETEEEWKDSLPDKKEGQSVRGRIVDVARSQKGYKESGDNYEVDNETDKRGWSRYGAWDGAAYENWDSAFVRFVLHYSDVDADTEKKNTADWQKELSETEKLENVSRAEPGDVIFAYDEDDEVKAGIVVKADQNTIIAMMGDWTDEVMEKSFPTTSQHLHSVWKPVESEVKQTEDNTEVPEIPEEQQPTEEETDNTNTEPTEEVKEETSWENTKEVQTEDGASIKVSWNNDAFEAQDVTFLATKAELAEEAQKQIEAKVQDQEQNYNYLTYDLTFYERRAGEDLIEIEPVKPVKVEITLPEQMEGDKKFDLYHTDDNGNVEKLVEQGNLTADEQEDSSLYTAEFEADSFSLFTVVIQSSDINWISGNDPNLYWGKISGDTFTGYVNKLSGDVTLSYKELNPNTDNALIIDLNGYKITANSDTLFDVKNGFTLILKNTSDSGHQTITYSNEQSTYGTPQTSTVQTALIQGINSSDVIKVTRGRLQIENVAIQNGGTQIYAGDGAKVDLNNAYLLKGNRGICLVDNSELEMNGGAISDHPEGQNNSSALPGAGMYVRNSKVKLDENAVIANNTVKTFNSDENVGGGIFATGSNTTIELNHAYIAGNKCWGNNGGGWATGGGIKARDRAKVYLKNGATVTGNLADDSGGGISLSDDETYLYMMDGSYVTGNCAHAHEGGGISLQAQDSKSQKDGHSTAVLLGGTISNNKTDTGNGSDAQWGGGGIFVGHTAKLILPNGADVYNNTAGNLGGGVAGCSTGKIYVDKTLTVKNNAANGNGVWSTGEKQYDKDYAQANGLGDKSLAHDYFTCFYASVPGEFSDAPANWKGSVDKQRVNGVVDGRLTSQYCLGLTSTDSAQVYNKPVKIFENTSYTHGGGILVNGYMVSGDVEYIYNSDTFNVEGTKQILSNNKEVTSGYEDFVFDLKLGDVLVGSATPDNKGTFRITNIVTQSTTTGNQTIQYYLTERNTQQAGVEFDDSQYRIDVAVNTTQGDTWTYSYLNPTDNQTHTVTVVEYTNAITGVKVYKKSGNDWSDYPYTTTQETTELSQRKQMTVKLDHNNKTFTNTLHKKNIDVEKKWSDGGNHDPVVVVLMRSTNEDHSNPETVAEITLGNPNWNYSWEDLPATNSSNQTYYYWVEEKSAVNGYIPVITTETDTDKDTVTITNTKISNTLKILKVEKGNETKLLPGAEFTLYKGTDDTGEIVDKKVTDNKGSIEFTDLREGTYFLKETKAPDGYEMPEKNGWTVTFDNTNEEDPVLKQEKTIENTLLVYSLPETGSTGTRFYTAAGTALLISSAALYEYNKKRKKKGGD